MRRERERHESKTRQLMFVMFDRTLNSAHDLGVVLGVLGGITAL